MLLFLLLGLFLQGFVGSFLILELSDIEVDFILDQFDEAWVNVEVTDHLICYTLRCVFKHVEVEARRAALCVPRHRVLNCNIDHVL